MVAHYTASLLPKLQEHFAEFLQHHSLKRLSILYPFTSVGLRYGLSTSGYFQEVVRCKLNPLRIHNFPPSSLSKQVTEY